MRSSRCVSVLNMISLAQPLASKSLSAFSDRATAQILQMKILLLPSFLLNLFGHNYTCGMVKSIA